MYDLFSVFKKGIIVEAYLIEFSLALVSGLLIGYFLTFLQPKVKLLYWSPHFFFFDLKDANVHLKTDALTIQNLGRKTARNVEIILNKEPDFFQFSPAIKHDVENRSDEEFIIRIPTLGPKEFITMQTLNYRSALECKNIRSEDGPGKQMPFQIAQTFSKWVYVLVFYLMLSGVGVTIYWLLKLVFFVNSLSALV